MNDPSQQQEAQDHGPVEPLDIVIAHLTALIQSLETKSEKEAEQAQIPADIPRFVTYR
jgi:hypothetical protein